MNPFDEKAKTWDDNPGRNKLTNAVFDALQKNLSLNEDMTVLDYGCGTGALALRLAPLVGRIEALDSSREMTNVLRDKSTSEGIENVLAHFSPSPLASQLAMGPFDLIIASMVTHHVEDLDAFFATLAKWSRPGARLAIADLEPEDGSFHQSDHNIFHLGFAADELNAHLTKHGFSPVSHETIHTMCREVDSCQVHFPIFLNLSNRNTQ